MNLDAERLEAERNVIGQLPYDPERFKEKFARVSTILVSEDFSDPLYSKTYPVLKDLYEQSSIPIDQTTITFALREALGSAYIKILELWDDTPTDATLIYWAKKLKWHSYNRELTECIKVGDINRIRSITDKMASLERGDGLYRAIKDVPSLSENPKAIIPTGFSDHDRISKFGPGDLMGVGGVTGVGKTSFCTSILHNISKTRPVGVVTLEMTAEEYRFRWENSFGHLPANLFIADPYALSTSDLKAISRALKEEQGVEVLLIDYLQLIREREDFRTRHLEVSSIIRKIKQFAKELRLAFIVISQLSRTIDHRKEGSLPSLLSLKESGDIEYCCDEILFLHQPIKGDEDFKGANVKLLILAKNRWGPTGKIKVYWDGPKTRFGNFQEGGDNDGG